MAGRRGAPKPSLATRLRTPPQGTGRQAGNEAGNEAETAPLPVVRPKPGLPVPMPRARGTVAVRPRARPLVPALRFAPPPPPPAPPRRMWVSRAVLGVILIVQAVMSLSLRNTAFQDEALYLYAGHEQLENLLHGTPVSADYSSYFSGSPLLYPVAAAFLDGLGGLALARGLSLLCMLGSTALLYSLSRMLFNERVALLSAGLFGVTAPVLFLGNFATYDAPAVVLLAAGAWIVVRTARSTRPWFLAAAAPLALAVAVKYAALMFVPTVVALAAVVAFPFHAWRAALRAVWLTLGVGALLGLSVLVTGTKALKGVTSTTTNRAEGDTPLWTLLHDSGLWIGPVFLLALYGTFAYTRRARTEEQNTGPFEPFPAAGEGQAAKWWRLALGVLLTATALLPVAYQVHLQTHVSLHKHVGFGLLFAAPMAGIGLTRILGEHFRRPHLGVAVWCVVAVLGLSQGKALFTWWPDSGKAVQSVRPYLKPDGHYLSDVVEVPVYYLGSQTRPTQWTTPYFFQYRDRSGAVLSGDPAYREAVRDGWFDVILFDNDTSGFNTALTPVIRESGNYRLRASLPQPGRAGTYFIWVRS